MSRRPEKRSNEKKRSPTPSSSGSRPEGKKKKESAVASSSSLSHTVATHRSGNAVASSSSQPIVGGVPNRSATAVSTDRQPKFVKLSQVAIPKRTRGSTSRATVGLPSTLNVNNTGNIDPSSQSGSRPGSSDGNSKIWAPGADPSATLLERKTSASHSTTPKVSQSSAVSPPNEELRQSEPTRHKVPQAYLLEKQLTTQESHSMYPPPESSTISDAQRFHQQALGSTTTGQKQAYQPPLRSRPSDGEADNETPPGLMTSGRQQGQPPTGSMTSSYQGTTGHMPSGAQQSFFTRSFTPPGTQQHHQQPVGSMAYGAQLRHQPKSPTASGVTSDHHAQNEKMQAGTQQDHLQSVGSVPSRVQESHHETNSETQGVQSSSQLPGKQPTRYYDMSTLKCSPATDGSGVMWWECPFPHECNWFGRSQGRHKITPSPLESKMLRHLALMHNMEPLPGQQQEFVCSGRESAGRKCRLMFYTEKGLELHEKGHGS